MAAPTLHGQDLGTVSSIRVMLMSSIWQISMPTQDSASAQLFDMLGVTREITVIGNWSGATSAATKAKVDAVKALVDKEQTATVEFISDQTGNLKVMLSSFETTWSESGIGVRCDYTIKLFLGTK